MEADTIDQIIRSRPTILEVLKDRGYDVATYENTSPEEILKVATTSALIPLLKIIATKPGATEDAPPERAIVLYWVENACRLRVETDTNALWDDEAPEHYNPETDTIMVMLAESYHPVFDIQAAKQWNIVLAKQPCQIHPPVRPGWMKSCFPVFVNWRNWLRPTVSS